MIRTLDFNALPAGTPIDDEYRSEGVLVSATGGADSAMIFDSAVPAPEEPNLQSDSLQGVLAISQNSDGSGADVSDDGGSIFFDFTGLVRMKSITLKNVEEIEGTDTRIIYYDAEGAVIDNHFVSPTGAGGEVTLGLNVADVARVEVRLAGPAAIDNVAFDSDAIIDAENVAPVASDDTAETDEDVAVNIPVLLNDSDANADPLSITAASSEQGTVSITDDGQLQFTPDPDFSGEAQISYAIGDGNGGSDTALVRVLVAAQNDAPEATADVAMTPEGVALENIDVLSNDTDPDGAEVLRLVSAASDDGSVTLNPDGTLNFAPNDGFVGTASVTYTISDRPDGDIDAQTDTGVLTIDVTDADGGPDGFVDGSATDDLIDADYGGDPNGDRIDNDDALTSENAPDDDFVRAGDGNDTVISSAGSDTILAGAGDDLVDTGQGALAPDLGYPSAATDALGFEADSDPLDDRDLVDGGAGDDTIRTGDDRDTITGGAGADDINAGIDDDLIDGGDDDDRIVGGEGRDSIIAGAGNDTVYAGNDPSLGLDVFELPDEADPGNPSSPDRNPINGQDTVDGGAGDDVIFGADDDDLLSGGAGDDLVDGQLDDDTIDGGAGADTLIGGQGDDSITGGDGDDDIQGGAGDDSLSGGAGQDVFRNLSAGDTVDGGSGAVDFDTLDLRGSAVEGGNLSVDYTSDNRESGVVTYFDADAVFSGQLVFDEIESVVPCFTPGTRIATPRGERRVEDLEVGDRVITRDNGMQRIRWVGARKMTGPELVNAPHLRPVLIRRGTLDNGLPERDMMVSPNHRFLVANDKTALYFEEREVLVAAKHLTHKEGVDRVEVSATTYIHIMFDHHEVILSDGTWTESFQPGDTSLAGLGNAQRDEIVELFPELATREGVDNYPAARRSLKKHEAMLLAK